MLIQSVELTADVFKNRSTISDTLLNIKDMNEVEIQSTGDILLHTVSDLLKHPSLKSRIAGSMHYKAENSATQQSKFSALLGSAIQLVQRLQDTPCQPAATEMLGNVFGLLSIEDLIACAQVLLKDASDDVRRVVITAVANKVQDFKQINNEGSTALLSFLPTLDKSLDQVAHFHEKESVIQCCTRIATKVGKKDPSALIAIVSRIAGPHCLGSGHTALQIQSLLAIALLVRILKEELLPQVPALLSSSFEILRTDLSSEVGNIELHEAIFTVINAIGQTVPFALAGSFLDDGLQLAQRSSSQLDEPVAARSAFYDSIANRVNAAEAFSAIERNFYSIEKEQDFDSIVEYYKLAKGAVTAHTKSEVLKNSSTLFKFVKEALGLRALKIAEGNASILSTSDVEELELLVIDITLSMVMKMNDATFRPFFIQLVDWASFKQTKPSATQIAKATTLFHLMQALLHRLRGLMTSYVSYLLEFAVFVLTLPAEGDAQQSLLTSTLRALKQSFECDEDGKFSHSLDFLNTYANRIIEYWQSPTHFTTIKKPLLDLLSQPFNVDLSQTIISAVTAFASAANSADHFKAMNGDIMSLFRSTSPATRLTAVKTQRSLTDVLGEDWLVHLPEMLPLITELLEDDDEKVERETRLWIKNVEDIVGENLDSMLQ
jgi:U3 small nucleolar RNA-associated protein 10